MSAREASIRARLMDTFRAEAAEHVQTMATGLASLDQSRGESPAPELVEEIFRSTHSLKGAARAMGIREIEAVCQAMEGPLRGVTRGETQLTARLTGALSEAVRTVERLLGGADAAIAEQMAHQIAEAASPAADDAGDAASSPLSQSPSRQEPAVEPGTNGRAPASAAPNAQGESGASRPLDTLRVARSRLDELLVQGEDFLVLKLAAQQRTRRARELADLLARCQGGSAGPEAMARAVAIAERLVGDLRRDERVTTRYVDRLHRQTRRLRLAPASSVFDLFPLMVADLAADRGKAVDLAMSGTELTIDLRILEAIKDPLIHLVRNAIDHGIESLDARTRAGKPERGRVSLRVAATGTNRVEISVEDDGAGIDHEQIRAAAARAGLITSDAAEALAPDAALELLFRSGFSTSAVITELSGLGLGLAIVRERVEGLGGRVWVESQPGRGTTVRMELPVTASTFRGLLVGAGGQQFLAPLDAVQGSMRVDAAEIRRAEGRDVLIRNGRVLPIARLDALLGLPRHDAGADRAGDGAAGERSRLAIVVLRVGDERAGFVVDEVLGDREVLVRELRAPLVRVCGIAGAGVLGSGDVALVLRPSDLVKMLSVQQAPAVDRARQVAPPMVLVADDSITTRMLIRNVLEAAGYRVRVAVDGLDAWAALQTDRYDLLVSDVDMPRMSGFELTSRVRADPAVKELPVVLVTALDSREDKERGIAAGASAYMVKSDMEQSNLLEIVGRFV